MQKQTWLIGCQTELVECIVYIGGGGKFAKMLNALVNVQRLVFLREAQIFAKCLLSELTGTGNYKLVGEIRGGNMEMNPPMVRLGSLHQVV